MRPEDAMRIIKRPYLTEKTFKMIEGENKLVFIVDEKASKHQVKKAVETLYGVKVEDVNTARTPVGKKAYVKMSRETPASELATRLGLV